MIICITVSQARGTTHWTRRGGTKLRVNVPLFCRDGKESVEHGRAQGADPQVHRVIAVARRNPTRHEADVSSMQVRCDHSSAAVLHLCEVTHLFISDVGLRIDSQYSKHAAAHDQGALRIPTIAYFVHERCVVQYNYF